MIKRRSFLAALAALPLCCIPFISKAKKSPRHRFRFLPQPAPSNWFYMTFTMRTELDEDGMTVKLFAGSIRHKEKPSPLSVTRVDIEKLLRLEPGFRRERTEISHGLWEKLSTFSIRDRQLADI